MRALLVNEAWDSCYSEKYFVSDALKDASPTLRGEPRAALIIRARFQPR